LLAVIFLPFVKICDSKYFLTDLVVLCVARNSLTLSSCRGQAKASLTSFGTASPGEDPALRFGMVKAQKKKNRAVVFLLLYFIF
jgi:hypothetical protein